MPRRLSENDLRLTTGFPFGLWQCQRRVVQRSVYWLAETFRVRPVPLAGQDEQMDGTVPHGSGRRRRDRRAAVPPAIRRAASLAASAKHDRLIVCGIAISHSAVINSFSIAIRVRRHRPDGCANGRCAWRQHEAGSMPVQVEAVWGGAVSRRVRPTPATRLLDGLATLPDGGPILAETLASPCGDFSAGCRSSRPTSR